MKALVVTTISDTIESFLIPHIKLLKELGFEVDIACKLTSTLTNNLQQEINNYYDVCFTRSIKSLNNYHAYKEMCNLLLANSYNLIYTHTPIASAIVRIANKNTIKCKVIYFAHGFHFYNNAPISNWLVFYPIEKYCSKYTDTLITLNSEDYNQALNLYCKNVKLLNGAGVNLNNFKHINILEFKNKLGIPDNAKVICSVGELNENKNHISIIKAIQAIQDKNIFYLIAGDGNLMKYLTDYINTNNLNKNIMLLGQRNDIPNILAISDLYCMPSYREGLPFSVMEAMASGLACLASNIRGNRDLIQNEKGGLLCHPNDIDCYAKKIVFMLENPLLLKEMGAFNKNYINNFSLSSVLYNLKLIFLNDINTKHQ